MEDPRDAATRARRETYQPVRKVTAARLAKPAQPTGPTHTGIDPGRLPDGLRGHIPAWLSRAHYVRTVQNLARTRAVQRLCRRHSIAVDTWVAILTEAATEAESRTGVMRASYATLGRIVGRGQKQVNRSLAIARKLGLAMPLFGPWYLNGDQRKALVATTPGHTQRGIPGVWQLAVIPHRIRVRIRTPQRGRWVYIPQHHAKVHPPRRGNLKKTNSPDHLLATAAHAAKTEPPPAAQPRRRAPRPGVALAWGICQHPHMALLGGVDPNSLAGLLHWHALGGWSAHQLVRELTAHALACRIDPRERARNPHGLLRMLLDRIDPDADMHLHGPALPAAPEPCERADCDGHGWLLAGPREPATKCPGCDPGRRTNHPW